MLQALGSAEITLGLIETHIYKPSPFFKDQFDCVARPTRKVWLRDGAVTTAEGFDYLILFLRFRFNLDSDSHTTGRRRC